MKWLGRMALGVVLVGCHTEPAPVPAASASATVSVEDVDRELLTCQADLASFRRGPNLPGAPAYEARRSEILGRARGEPVDWLKEPASTPDSELSKAALETRRALLKAPPFRRIKTSRERLSTDKPALRQLVLREGYVYASDPSEALALITLLDLQKLFDEPKIFLERGGVIHELTRVDGKFPVYRHTDGRTGELLFADRLALTRKELEKPLHRELRSAAREIGFDRARVLERREGGLYAELRFGETWIRTLLVATGPRLGLGCFDAPKAERASVHAWLGKEAKRRNALGQLHAAIDEELREALPFDRPREEETADRDGQLRPNWRWAFEHGQSWFSFDEKSYPVFDTEGRPHPPQVCVDFVLDSFERASGTWFQKTSTGAARVVGRLDFDAKGIKNRRSVLAFEKFAEENPSVFTHSRFRPEERIPFGERERFFAFLSKNADRFRPRDIVAIQGRKADGNIHQHAILIEDTDPVSGFPDALADQMKRPRRRTWEGIMAEAPLRSLLFHVRPADTILLSLADDTDEQIATTTDSAPSRGGG
jgi:hypothetical protein